MQDAGYKRPARWPGAELAPCYPNISKAARRRAHTSLLSEIPYLREEDRRKVKTFLPQRKPCAVRIPNLFRRWQACEDLRAWSRRQRQSPR